MSETDEVVCHSTGVICDIDDHVSIVDTYEGELAYFIECDIVHLHHVTENGEMRCLYFAQPDAIDELLKHLKAARNEAAEYEPLGDGG